MSLEDDEQSKLEFELDNLSCSFTLDDSFDNTTEASKLKIDCEDSNPNDLENVPTAPGNKCDLENGSPLIVSLMESLDDLISRTDSDDIRKWNRRLDNHKCFSEHFRRVPREVREVEDLAKLYLPSGGREGKKEDPFDLYLNLLNDNSKSKIKNMKTCLMKREPVIFCKKGDGVNVKIIGHLILLNKSFIIAPDHSQTKPAKAKFQDITTNISKGLSAILGKEKKYKCYHSITSVISLQAFDAEHSDDPPLPSFCIKVLEEDHTQNYEIFCHSEARQEAWLDAFKTCIPKNFGFEYESFFSSIIFNDADLLQQCLSNRNTAINDQENVHGYTPLHLSVITNKIDYMSELLSFGANTDTFANDETSPLVSATRMENEIAIDLLKNFGATIVAAMEQERTDANVNARQELLRGRKNSTSNVNTGGSPPIQTVARPNIDFGKIMLGFKERGERLQDVSVKSSILNEEAKTYGDLTRKLKDRLEKKNKNWLGI